VLFINHDPDTLAVEVIAHHEVARERRRQAQIVRVVENVMAAMRTGS
jgi:hypothetical protein